MSVKKWELASDVRYASACRLLLEDDLINGHDKLKHIGHSDISMSIFSRFKNPKSDSADNEVELDFDPDNPFPDPIEFEITDVFDLHTIQPREVKAVVEEYLQQAFEKGFKSVRIIHGKGIGVQREIVRSVLAATPFVVDWTDAPAEAGGWGATIVRFRI